MRFLSFLYSLATHLTKTLISEESLEHKSAFKNFSASNLFPFF